MKTHVKHHLSKYKGYPDFGICGHKGAKKFSYLVEEVDCMNCRRELTKYVPWKQESVAQGREETNDMGHSHYPFNVRVKE